MGKRRLYHTARKDGRRGYAKAGFKREGVLRDAVMDGGEYADDILMALLENEWKLIKAR